MLNEEGLDHGHKAHVFVIKSHRTFGLDLHVVYRHGSYGVCVFILQLIRSSIAHK